MGIKHIRLASLATCLLAIGYFLSNWDWSQALGLDLAWVLQELPEVKSVEYLDALKKG